MYLTHELVLMNLAIQLWHTNHAILSNPINKENKTESNWVKPKYSYTLTVLKKHSDNNQWLTYKKFSSHTNDLTGIYSERLSQIYINTNS